MPKGGRSLFLLSIERIDHSINPEKGCSIAEGFHLLPFRDLARCATVLRIFSTKISLVISGLKACDRFRIYFPNKNVLTELFNRG